MTPPLHQPHDYLFADPEETAAFLRARLPGSHQRGILWSSLRRAAGSFIDQELRDSVSDLLFEMRSAAAAPRQWLYLLFEHQSQPDRWMALRLLRYCRRIWEADRRDYPDEQMALSLHQPPPARSRRRASSMVPPGQARPPRPARRAAMQSAAAAAPL